MNAPRASQKSAEMLPSRVPDIWFMRLTPLYVRLVGGEYALYKKSGLTLTEMGLQPEDLPNQLFIRMGDRVEAIKEVQNGYADGYVRKCIKEGKGAELKQQLTGLLENAFAEPRMELVLGFRGMVGEMADQFAAYPGLLASFARLAAQSYSLASHSVNVMALMLAFCLREQLPSDTTGIYVFAALFHDVGMTQLRPPLSKPVQTMNRQELRAYQHHPQLGADFLRLAGMHELVMTAAADHHERCDGTGFPKGKSAVHPLAQLVGLIDCFEHLTSQRQAYQKPMEPLEVLRLLREHQMRGKFDAEIFERFAYSLA